MLEALRKLFSRPDPLLIDERIAPTLSIQDSGAQYVLSDREAMAEIFQIPTFAGPPVTARTAMLVSTVYACTRLIAGAIASLPVGIYERLDNDGRKSVKHDLWWLLNEQPTDGMTAAVFWEYITACVLLQGDGFALIIRNRNGVAQEFLPVSPLEVRVDRKDKRLVYYINAPDLGTFGVDQDDMLHFMGFGFNGRRSMSVISSAARGATSIALAADEHAARFFSSGAQPAFSIIYPNAVTDEQITKLRERWAERQAGTANAHKPIVLTHGAELKELTINAEQAQLLETRKFQVVDIARAFGVPPFMLGETEKQSSWGTGVEHMGQGFVSYTLAPHLQRFEQEVNRKYFRAAKYFMEFNVDGLLRGDAKSRADYLRQARGGSQGPGWMTSNEIRKLDNLPPLDDGDTVYEMQPGVAAPGAGNKLPA